jgi:hypothetical protein
LFFHYVSLFSIDQDLRYHSERDNEVQQVSGKELGALAQVGPPNGRSEQNREGDHAANKNPAQVTWFALFMAAAGLCGIVVGVGIYVHNLNLSN